MSDEINLFDIDSDEDKKNWVTLPLPGGEKGCIRAATASIGGCSFFVKTVTVKEVQKDKWRVKFALAKEAQDLKVTIPEVRIDMTAADDKGKLHTLSVAVKDIEQNEGYGGQLNWHESDEIITPGLLNLGLPMPNLINTDYPRTIGTSWTGNDIGPLTINYTQGAVDVDGPPPASEEPQPITPDEIRDMAEAPSAGTSDYGYNTIMTFSNLFEKEMKKDE